MYHGGWRSRYRCYKQLTAQDGPNGGLSSSITFFSFLFIKTWCTSNQISDHSAHIDEFSWHNFISKICGPIIRNEHLWVCTKFMCLHIPISLLCIQNNAQVPKLHYSVQDSTCKQHFQMFLRVLTSLQPSGYILKCIIDGTYK